MNYDDLPRCAVHGCHNLACEDGYCMRCNEEIEAMGLWYQEQAKPKVRFWAAMRGLAQRVGLL